MSSPLIASLESDSRPPREYFRAFQARHGRMPDSVCVWVGPEGDFTPAETEMIKSQSTLPITLGRLVLRAETAAIYCLSVLHYELQSPAVHSLTAALEPATAPALETPVPNAPGASGFETAVCAPESTHQNESPSFQARAAMPVRNCA